MNPVAITWVEACDVIAPDTDGPTGELLCKKLAAGSSAWMRKEGKASHFCFTCPCGCGMITALPVQPVSPDGWHWDGNEKSPSINPSIRQMQGCKWHGYVTKGVFLTV